MSGRLDPSAYDLAELRRAADVSGGVDEPGAGPRRSARDALRAQVHEAVAERDLTAVRSARTRPFLDDLPDSLVGVRTAYEWLEFLQRRVGDEGAREALAYYERVGWLSPAATARLREFLTGLNPSFTRQGSLTDLDADDHRLSYDYVTKLSAFAGRERDRRDGP
jgi:archaellum component FlaD/FlaE